MKTKAISLREFLEQRIDAIDDARVIQASELARRLEELNHAHERSQKDRGDFLSRDTYEENRKETDKWREGVSNSLALAKGEATARAGMYSVVASLIVGLIVLIMGHFWK